MTGADQKMPQLVRHRIPHYPIGVRDWIHECQLANCAVVDVCHIARAVNVHERPSHGLERRGSGLGDVPSNAHPNDEIRAHPCIRRVHFRAAACPLDLDAHGLKHVGGLGLRMLDYAGRKFANIAEQPR